MKEYAIRSSSIPFNRKINPIMIEIINKLSIILVPSLFFSFG